MIILTPHMPQHDMRCPQCKELDCLELVTAERGYCTLCSAVLMPYDPSTSVLAQKLACPECPWIGVVKDCEPDDDGELCCPQCDVVLTVKIHGVDE